MERSISRYQTPLRSHSKTTSIWPSHGTTCPLRTPTFFGLKLDRGCAELPPAWCKALLAGRARQGLAHPLRERVLEELPAQPAALEPEPPASFCLQREWVLGLQNSI